MDSELEVIRDQMHQTRASLADKLDALENQVRETVQTATDAVTATVDTVKGVSDTVMDTVEGVTDKVQSTVESVAETFDVSRYVDRYPWASFGVAVAAGFAGGYLIGGSEKATHRRDDYYPPPAPAAPVAAGVPRQQEESWLESMPEGVKTALNGLQGLAVGAMMGVVGELVRSSLPAQLQGELGGLVDRVTSSLGGKKLDMSFLRKDDQRGDAPAPQAQSHFSAANPGATTSAEPEQPAPAKRSSSRRAADGRR